MSQVKSNSEKVGWTFLSNHSHVLICLAGEPTMRMRDVAQRVGITERAVQRIVSELEEGGALKRIREGRQNRYEIDDSLPLRHGLESHRTIGDILEVVLQKP
jgi:DNA-binding MarR family transcriptional regulator